MRVAQRHRNRNFISWRWALKPDQGPHRISRFTGGGPAAHCARRLPRTWHSGALRALVWPIALSGPPRRRLHPCLPEGLPPPLLYLQGPLIVSDQPWPSIRAAQELVASRAPTVTPMTPTVTPMTPTGTTAADLIVEVCVMATGLLGIMTRHNATVRLWRPRGRCSWPQRRALAFRVAGGLEAARSTRRPCLVVVGTALCLPSADAATLGGCFCKRGTARGSKTV